MPKEITYSFDYFAKATLPLISAIVVTVIGGIFWVQGYVEDHAYAKSSGTVIERQMTEIKDDIKILREQNSEILVALSMLEGKIEVMREKDD